MKFDPGQLIDGLPRHTVVYPATIDTTRLPRWHAGPVGPYNGFSGRARLSHWQLAVCLRRAGAFPLPTACDLCPTTTRIVWHAEHYGDIARSIALCWPCHMALHRRFVTPRAWANRIDRCEQAQPAWVRHLAPQPVNLARWLKRHHGPNACDPWRFISRRRPARSDGSA